MAPPNDLDPRALARMSPPIGSADASVVSSNAVPAVRATPASADAGAVERPDLAVRVLVVAYLAVAIWYLAWRAGSLNPAHPALSWTIYGAELFAFATAAAHLFMCWRLTLRTPPPAAPGLSVDVFVTTYDEPVEMLRRTLLAARDMLYPHRTWLLDDGNRMEMRLLAKELGVRYLARAENTDAKAGNLNHGLLASRAAFVAVFDADHAPGREFLVRTLGYFADPAVAFVQTPQDFYNLDSFQHRRRPGQRLVWTEQSLFFRVIQRGKDACNAAFFCGSCAILRRAALEDIGGFATGTVTEDLHTSVRLHKAGWRSVYHAESLAFGLAPPTAVPFLRQRIRWGQGAMQVWKRERLLLSRHLTPAQKLCYLATLGTYFDGWQKAIFYFAPAIVLATGAVPIAADSNAEFLVRFLPYFVLTFWMYEEIGRGYGRTLQIEQYNMARFAAYIVATLALVRGRLPFLVTAKQPGTVSRTRRAMTPQFAVIAANGVALPLAVGLQGTAHALPPGALVANAVWACVNIVLAALVVRFSLRVAAYRRREYRFPVPVPVRLHASGEAAVLGILDDVSSSGFRYYGPLPARVAPGLRLEGDLFLPSGAVPFTATLRALVREADDARVKGIGCRFDWPRAAERDALDRYLYGTDLQWRLHGLDEQAATPLALLRSAASGRPRAPAPALHWAPVLVHESPLAARATEVGFVSLPADRGSMRCLATHRPLDCRRRMQLRLVTRTGAESIVGLPRLTRRIETSGEPLFLYELAS